MIILMIIPTLILLHVVNIKLTDQQYKLVFISKN